MKKTKTVRGFWSWLMGHGWENIGVGGLGARPTHFNLRETVAYERPPFLRAFFVDGLSVPFCNKVDDGYRVANHVA